MLDAVIVGGGPAGLSAALVLGRSRRAVVVVDAARPRNAGTGAVHGFLTRDGTPPAELRALARAEVARYPTVRVVDGEVVDVARADDGFRATLADGSRVEARCAVIAIGQRDRLPPVPGLADAYGRVVHQCPYCDAWEHADRALACLGADAHGLALKLRRWSGDVVWLSEGGAPPEPRTQALDERGIVVVPTRVLAVDAAAGGIDIALADGTRLRRDALFVQPAAEPWPRWVTALGCRIEDGGAIGCDRRGETSVPGLYVAGDASAHVQFAIVAAAEGARAAVAIDDRLLRATLGAAARSP